MALSVFRKEPVGTHNCRDNKHHETSEAWNISWRLGLNVVDRKRRLDCYSDSGLKR